MGQNTYVFPINVTCPIGVTAAAPQVTLPKFGDVWLDSCELRIPPGHHGTTGVYVANNGTQVLPWSDGITFLNGDNDLLTFDLGDEFDTGFQIVTYNTDAFPHTFYFRFSGRFMVDQLAIASPTVPTVVPIA
jgi:hypothetical protein